MFLKNLVAKDHSIIMPNIEIAIGAIIAIAENTLSFIRLKLVDIIVNCASNVHPPQIDKIAKKMAIIKK